MKKYQTPFKFHRRVRKGHLEESVQLLDVPARFTKTMVINLEFISFSFPKSNPDPDKLRWCNLIKRRDSCDGFKVNKKALP